MKTPEEKSSDLHTPADCDFLDLQKTSVHGGLKVDTLRGHIRSGSLQAYRVGGKILINWGEYCQWVRGFRINDIQAKVDEMLAGLE